MPGARVGGPRAISPAASAAADEAVRQHDRLPLPFELGRTLLVKGTVQRRAKRKREARDTLTQALEIFEGSVLRAWAERTRAELARIGGRAPSSVDLTPTEARVAELVAAGGTNREVADALFVSVHTIEANLKRIYRKLGIRSRTGAGVDLPIPALRAVGKTYPPCYLCFWLWGRRSPATAMSSCGTGAAGWMSRCASRISSSAAGTGIACRGSCPAAPGRVGAPCAAYAVDPLRELVGGTGGRPSRSRPDDERTIAPTRVFAHDSCACRSSTSSAPQALSSSAILASSRCPSEMWPTLPWSRARVGRASR